MYKLVYTIIENKSISLVKLLTNCIKYGIVFLFESEKQPTNDYEEYIMENIIKFTGALVSSDCDGPYDFTTCIDRKAHVTQHRGRDWQSWGIGSCTCGEGPSNIVTGEVAQALADFLKDGKTRHYDSFILNEDGDITPQPKYTEDGIEKPLPSEYCAAVESPDSSVW